MTVLGIKPKRWSVELYDSTNEDDAPTLVCAFAYDDRDEAFKAARTKQRFHDDLIEVVEYPEIALVDLEPGYQTWERGDGVATDDWR